MGIQQTLEDCIAAGEHLKSVDSDGYCNACGHQPGAVESAPTTVWVLLYEHKHGTDTSVYDSGEAAEKSACAIVLEWLEDEIEERDAREDIVAAIEKKQYSDALALYSEHCSYRETFEICEHSIEAAPDGDLEKRLVEAKESLKQAKSKP